MLDLWSYLAFSLGIVLAAVVMCVWHIRAWRGFRQGEHDAGEYDFRRRQFRRRIQASAMVGLLGLAVFGGCVMMVLRWNPLAITLYWLAVMVVLGWLGLLALADMVATKQYYGRIQDRYAVEQARLKAELRRIQAIQGNGHSGPDKSKHPQN